MVFCDWLTAVCMPSLGIGSVKSGTPLFHGGFVHQYTPESELVSIRHVPGAIEGSHCTSIRCCTIPPLLTVSGNPGRFSRPDNLFGYSVRDSIARMQAIASAHGLRGVPGDNWRPSRFDLTRNYATGSIHNARAWLSWLAGQKTGRAKSNSYGDGTTVMWRTKRWTAKAYLKSAEIRRHNPDCSSLIEYCDDVGLVRLELTLRGDILRSRGVGTLASAKIKPSDFWIDLFEEFMSDALSSASTDDRNDLPTPILGTLLAWENGVDVSARLSRRTFYRHRRYLLNAQGVDISMPVAVERLNVRPRILDIRPLSPPDWYDLPPPTLITVDEA